jgi:ABC-type methionine transport system ATPase subunit
MVLLSTHRFDIVETLCSRAVILSSGRLVAEHRVRDIDRAGTESLEDLFARVTDQPDYTAVARQIIDTVCVG